MTSRIALIAICSLILPLSVSAASYDAARTLIVASSTVDNAYLLGGTVNVEVPEPADLTAVGGSVGVSGDVSGDVLLVGGDVTVLKPVKGDARILGGRVTLNDAISGDLVAVAATLTDTGGGAKSTFIAAGSAYLLNGADGPVTVYAANATLAGTFDGDVHVTASNRLELSENTVIHGTLYYDAPEEATIPASVQIDGGSKYTGQTYLPTAAQAQAFVAAGMGVFLVVQILAALIAAGLVIGLFPSFAQNIVDRALLPSTRRFFLLILLGFAIIVATPVLLLLLSLTLVGLGVAFILGTAYVLALLLAYCYAAGLTGSLLARRLLKRSSVLWRDAVIGVFALFLIGAIPYIGRIVVAALIALALGSLVSLSFEYCFKDTEETLPLTDL